MPRVSIIMNVRNGASFLREALDSVMAQTFQDWELIVWDDRSTDESTKIVAEYHDPRIRYFLSPEETPLGEASNSAIRQAKGQWLAFLDQDDIWLPRKLQQQMALADDRAGIIYGRTIQFYLSGEERDYDYAHEFRPLPEGDIFTQLFADACFIAMSSAGERACVRTRLELARWNDCAKSSPATGVPNSRPAAAGELGWRRGRIAFSPGRKLWVKWEN